MFFKLASTTSALLVALAALSRAAPSASNAVQPKAKGVAVNFPVRTLDVSAARAPSTSLTNAKASRAIIKRQEFPADLLVCAESNCGLCEEFSLSGLAEDECFFVDFSGISVAISQPSGQGLPFAVEIGEAGCPSLTQVPTVNECFNLNGFSFDSFALLP